MLNRRHFIGIAMQKLAIHLQYLKSELMKHRKQEHVTENKTCLKAEKGICKFGKKCWYLHEDIANENNRNQEVFETVFDMMDKMTHRIVNGENNL